MPRWWKMTSLGTGFDRVFAAVAGEVSVVAVDHVQAGAHVAGEIEGGDAGTKAKVAKVWRRS